MNFILLYVRNALDWKNLWRRQNLIYSSNLTHLRISQYHSLSDKKIKGILHLFPNIIHLDFEESTDFTDKALKLIAESYPNLKSQSCHKLEYLSISLHTGLLANQFVILFVLAQSSNTSTLAVVILLIRLLRKSFVTCSCFNLIWRVVILLANKAIKKCWKSNWKDAW